METTTFTKLYDPFDRAAAPAKFQPLRQSARQRLREIPFPTPRTEDWRFTSVAPILQAAYTLPAPSAIDAATLPPLPTPDAVRLVFVNGRFDKALSRITGLPAGVQVGSLADADPAVLQAKLARIASGDPEQAFTVLNTSFLSDGAYVVAGDNVVVTQPIEIICLTTPGATPAVTHPRVLLIAGRSAQVTVIERFLATGPGVYFTNAVTEVLLAEHAVVDHVKLQQESLQAYHVANTQVVMAAKSNFTTHFLSFGGALVRNEVRVRFDGEHAEATVNGLYLADGTQHIDNHTVIDHAKPNCASHEVYKGVLGGKSHGVFNGKIFVRKDAQKTDAKQTNKVLLLSDDATINTKPQLEIFADDVKCTHGATIGQLDAGQLFYLRSRGVGEAAARRLLTYAFANDIVNRLKIESIRDQMEALIVK
jgi:Fe-S cluster assembly protein SufD